ncbi:MAG: RNA 2',3'-cyclic phosphodiesterase [Beijerinckiaceae bacterium]|nr:RNA 2',3'-cyclic phosphodiesterase [Beijerinckiaceae bacterium]
MPRLFTGLEIPSDLAMDLSMLRGGLSGARWIDAENYHLTLRFIGDINESTAREVHSTLETIRFSPFTVTIEGLSSFGGAKPRALIAKAKSAPALVELQGQHERLMRRIGIAPDPRKFIPHVTLARLRAASCAAVAEYLSATGFFFARQFEAKRFVLFSSRASTGGGPYIVEAAYPLG